MGLKMLSLQDNRLKILPATKGIGSNFLMKCTKIKSSYVQFTKIFKISPPCSMHRKPHKIQGIQIVIIFTFLLIISQNKRF
jgi:hypothetical protein